jgi:aldose 1-epimerase
MPDKLPRRQVLRTAGALGLGAATAGALEGAAQAVPDQVGTPLRAGPGRGRLTIRKAPFGRTSAGEQVDVYTFTNGRITISMLTRGATLQRVETPDSRGRIRNISLGFDNLADYEKLSPYFGATIGRYGNRIARGRFTLDGKTYQIPPNDGPNALHGGPVGFDKKVWRARVVQTASSVGVAFTYVSPNGEMGFPGTLTTVVTYTLNTRDQLTIHYEAVTNRPTVLNLTNHVYLNLAGEGSGSIDDQVLRLNAPAYTPVNTTLIPTGQIAPVKGTPFDFNRPTRIGARLRDNHPQLVIARGYDHNFVLGRPGAGGLRPTAQAWDPDSGRKITVHTTEPGVQVYTGNFLDGTFQGISGKSYRQGDAFTLETQHFPDSPNHPNFPSTVLRPGNAFRSTTIFTFGTR